MVHTGTLIDGALDDENPYDPKDLVAENIRQEVFDYASQGTGNYISGAELRAAARSRKQSWNNVVAHAIWQAEERRQFNYATACAGFESNPFKWMWKVGSATLKLRLCGRG